jgi:hypothetical protein
LFAITDDALIFIISKSFKKLYVLYAELPVFKAEISYNNKSL